MPRRRRETVPCRCRNCNCVYDELRSTADYKGYCSQRCLHTKARSLGWRSRLRPPDPARPFEKHLVETEYRFLRRHGEIGSIRHA